MGESSTRESQDHLTVAATNRDHEILDPSKNDEEMEPYYSQVLSVMGMDNKVESTCEMNPNICYNIVQSANASVPHI